MLGLSDAQFVALCTLVGGAGAGFVALVRWAVGVWREDRKEERDDRKLAREEQREDRREDRAATMAVASAMSTMAAKFDEHARTLGAMRDDFDEITGVHSTRPQAAKKRARTEPMGSPVMK